jgi:catechol 2,3-dioxygenase-like lactoylglutathione lyase family enzyme
MDLRNCSTAIFVRDINASKQFYCDVLGLKIQLDFGGNVILDPGLAIWEIQKDHIIPFSLGMEKINNTAFNRFEIYFETEDLTSVYNGLKQAGVRFLHEIHEEPWGQKTIRFFDPDCHLIEVGESMKTFVSGFYKKGMTVEQVSKRTSVPVDEVRRLLNIS